jgi:hypothetical protein
MPDLRVLSASAQSGKWRAECRASVIIGNERERFSPGPRPPKIDNAYAAHLRLRAANELEQAEQARAAVADLNALPSELHAQMQKED